MDSPEEINNSEINKPKRNRLRLAFRRGAALVLGLAALSGSVSTEQSHADAPAAPNVPTATAPDATALPAAPNIPVEGGPTTLDTPATIPAHHTKIEIPKHLISIDKLLRDAPPLNPEVVDRQLQATAELMGRPKGSTPDTPYELLVTGLLVKKGQKLYLETASHPLGITTGSSTGSVNSSDPSVKALNYNNRATMEYAIADPDETSASYRMTHPIGYVTEINVAATGKDIAALEVAPSNIDQTEGLTLDQKKPLDGDNLANKQPKLGDPVSLVSIPKANGFKLTAVKGIYLGEETYYPNRYINVDVNTGQNSINSGINKPKQRMIIAIKAPSPSKDASNFGGSGASTFTNSGGVLGFMSTRNNIGYGSNKKMQNIEQLSLQDNKLERLLLEKNLKVNLSTDEYTLYAIDVPNPDTLSALQNNAMPVPPLQTSGS